MEKKLHNHIRPLKQESPGNEFFRSMAVQVAVEHPRPSRLRLVTYKMWIPLVFAAASVIFFVLFISWETVADPKSTTIRFDVLQEKEIMAYIQDNLGDFESEELAEVMGSDFLAKNQSESITKPSEKVLTDAFILTESLSIDEIEAYLQEDELDIFENNENL